MKPASAFVAAVCCAAALAIGVPASGQTPAQKELPQAERAFNLTLEQRHTIKELLKDEKVDKAPGNIQVTAGAPAPANVTLHDMPTVLAEKVPQIKSHQFFLTGDKIVIVEPKDKKVAEVIE
jgi:hypothetical protein